MSEVKDWEKIAREMAKCLMDLSAGDDVHNKADRLVKKHFPDVYKAYE